MKTNSKYKIICSKRTFLLLFLSMEILLFSSCAENKKIHLPVLAEYDIQLNKNERKHLKLGVVTGPYEDMFNEVIMPLFSDKGYYIEIIVYDNYNDPNYALANGEIDFNMFQNYNYLNNFKFENDIELSAIAEIPTIPMGIYSNKYNSIDINDLEDGLVVAVPGDSINLARSLLVLNDAGVISINSTVDIKKIGLKDIVENPKNIQIIPVEAHLLTDTLINENYDLAVINGNYAINKNCNIQDALFNETLFDHYYLNIIAVRTGDLSETFVLDLIEVLSSEEFKEKITKANGKYCGYQYPCNFK